MATGRTLARWSRFYCDGYDLSGFTQSFGPLVWEFETSSMAMLSDEVLGTLPSHPTLGIGALNGVLATSTDSNATHDMASANTANGVPRDIMIPIGIRAAPAIGDPVYTGVFNQLGYSAVPAEGIVTVTVPFGAFDASEAMTYSKPWGVLLHEKGSIIAANTSTDSDDIVDNAAASTDGGYMTYQIFSITGDGTATITIEESDDAETWGALTSATSGDIADESAPTSGIVELATTASIKRYLRWQLALVGSTACNFALAFVRG